MLIICQSSFNVFLPIFVWVCSPLSETICHFQSFCRINIQLFVWFCTVVLEAISLYCFLCFLRSVVCHWSNPSPLSHLWARLDKAWKHLIRANCNLTSNPVSNVVACIYCNISIWFRLFASIHACLILKSSCTGKYICPSIELTSFGLYC